MRRLTNKSRTLDSTTLEWTRFFDQFICQAQFCPQYASRQPSQNVLLLKSPCTCSKSCFISSVRTIGSESCHRRQRELFTGIIIYHFIKIDYRLFSTLLRYRVMSCAVISGPIQAVKLPESCCKPRSIHAYNNSHAFPQSWR